MHYAGLEMANARAEYIAQCCTPRASLDTVKLRIFVAVNVLMIVTVHSIFGTLSQRSSFSQTSAIYNPRN